jgi:hypothetical protein
MTTDENYFGITDEEYEAHIDDIKQAVDQANDKLGYGGHPPPKLTEDEELAQTKLTREDIEFMFQTMMKESKYDELSIKQTVHGLNSAFTKLPIPHVVTSKESGAGRTTKAVATFMRKVRDICKKVMS